MECRFDAPQSNPSWSLQTAPSLQSAPVVNAVAEPVLSSSVTCLSTDKTPIDLRREFAEKLTRISNLLGVLTHLVRADDLPDDERHRFDASLQLAELEISQAGEMIRSNRKSSSRNQRNESVHVDEVFREAIDSFRLRWFSEGIECDTVLSQVNVECDQLVLRSMLFGLTKLATEACRRIRKGARLKARMLVDGSAVHILLDAVGPVCANNFSTASDESPVEASRESLERCEQLASVLGGNLSFRRVVGGEGLSLRFELPRTH